MTSIHVMINGLPGNVCRIIAAGVAAGEGFTLVPWSLTGPEITDETCTVAGKTVRLIRPEGRDAVMAEIVTSQAPFISVDFTHPTAVNANADFYCRHNLPFVMGTTGGDRERLAETVRQSSIAAVIAPNMAKQIVGLQAMMAYGAETFPDLFKGYRLAVTESHQQGKADTSGTAKAMVSYFNAMGIPFGADQIRMVRDPQTQRTELGIPEAHLGGHGWHTYTLTSADQTVTFEFTHNVNGRDIYTPGVLDAVAFLVKKITKGATGSVFSMIDVLKG
ncbi:MAG: dihydrodipicolinate reductase [Desulfobacterales bacterium]|nr:dihydrodipicolinate reductase [Desulfobacterales bacterium]